jgi:hypothetical protein
VIEARDGAKTCFIGSLNETREGWQDHYEIVWEDRSAEGVAWVEEEFRYLWQRIVPLPDAIIEEIGRLSRKVEVELKGSCADRRRRRRTRRGPALSQRGRVEAVAARLCRAVP